LDRDPLDFLHDRIRGAEHQFKLAIFAYFAFHSELQVGQGGNKRFDSAALRHLESGRIVPGGNIAERTSVPRAVVIEEVAFGVDFLF